MLRLGGLFRRQTQAVYTSSPLQPKSQSRRLAEAQRQAESRMRSSSQAHQDMRRLRAQGVVVR